MTAVYEQRLSRVGAVRVACRAVAETDGRHPVRASEHWGLSFIRRVDGALDAELDGPRRAAHVVSSSAGETYWGVEFRAPRRRSVPVTPTKPTLTRALRVFAGRTPGRTIAGEPPVT